MIRTKYQMKYILIVFFTILFHNLNIGQQIVIADKQWEGDKLEYPQEPYNSKFRENEVTIEGKKYRELTFKVEDGWFEGVGQYYREEDNKVYKLYEGKERVILDFTLEVGDTIRVSNDIGEAFVFVPFRTTDTIIQKKVRRKLEMRGYPVSITTSNSEKHVWIEGIGDVGFFFGNGEVYGNLKASPVYCVKEGVYIYGAGMFCPHFTVISNVKNDEFEPDFRYDQYSKKLYLSDKNIKRLDVYTISGIKLKSYATIENNNEIDLSSIDLSICVIATFDGNAFQSKILKL